MITCCVESTSGPWWMTLVAFDLLVLILLASFILMRHFNARDQRIRDAFRDARHRFMSAADEHRAELSELPTFIWVVLLGVAALAAFVRAKEVTPDLHPDADWLNTMRWIELKAKRFELWRG
jgi:ABC-type multidrug transport system fused ATPase/permease subunit